MLLQKKFKGQVQNISPGADMDTAACSKMPQQVDLLSKRLEEKRGEVFLLTHFSSFIVHKSKRITGIKGYVQKNLAKLS